MRVDAAGGSLLVTGIFGEGPSGGWLIGVSPVTAEAFLGDDVPIPQWDISIRRTEHAYSPALVITAPPDVVVTLVDDEGKPIAPPPPHPLRWTWGS